MGRFHLLSVKNKECSREHTGYCPQSQAIDQGTTCSFTGSLTCSDVA